MRLTYSVVIITSVDHYKRQTVSSVHGLTEGSKALLNRAFQGRRQETRGAAKLTKIEFVFQRTSLRETTKGVKPSKLYNIYPEGVVENLSMKRNMRNWRRNKHITWMICPIWKSCLYAKMVKVKMLSFKALINWKHHSVRVRSSSHQGKAGAQKALAR